MSPSHDERGAFRSGSRIWSGRPGSLSPGGTGPSSSGCIDRPFTSPGRSPTPAGARPLISSLAVDVEPIVFWDGSDPIPANLLDRWRCAVGFDDERHVRVRPGTATDRLGAGLAERILAPLRILPINVAYTDAVPWFCQARTWEPRGRGHEPPSHRPPNRSGCILVRFLPARASRRYLKSQPGPSDGTVSARRSFAHRRSGDHLARPRSCGLPRSCSRLE